MALAGRLEAQLRDPHALAHEPHVAAEHEPTLPDALAAAAPASNDGERPMDPPDGGRPDDRGRSTRLARIFFVGVAFVAVSGAAYWMLENSARAPNPRTTASDTPASAPEPASSTASAPPRAADTPAESSATAREPAAPSAETKPPAAEHAPERVEARMPSRTDTAQPPASGSARNAAAPMTDEMRHRTVPPVRSTGQAERDAAATRRLIERQLGDSPPSNTDDKPHPGQ